jgi:hypothetical protein
MTAARCPAFVFLGAHVQRTASAKDSPDQPDRVHPWARSRPLHRPDPAAAADKLRSDATSDPHVPRAGLPTVPATQRRRRCLSAHQHATERRVRVPRPEVPQAAAEPLRRRRCPCPCSCS